MKKIIGIAISVLMATLFCVTAFAVEPRWKNVIAISPTISAEPQSYSSYIVADPKATKMECTLVLYEKGFWGNYTEVDRTSSTYYGFRHEFNGSYAIKAGTTYKLTTTVTVTANGTSETVSYDFDKRC